MLEKLKQQAQLLKREAYALYIAARDPRVPWYARLLIALVVAHTFSPIDLIPDFIPVLGYLDDLLILPLGIALALKMIPAEVMTDCRAKAQAALALGRPVSRWAAVVIIALWVLLAGLAIGLAIRWWSH